MNLDISISGLVFGLLLVLPTLVLVWLFKLELNKRIAISVLRMVVQLAFVGLYLKYVFVLNSPWVNMAYVSIMIVAASFSSISSSSLKLKPFIGPTIFAVAIPALLSLFYFNWAIIQVNNIFEAQLIIPIAGLMLGNTLKSNIVALKTFYKSLINDEKKYQFMLSLGANRLEAVRPFMKESIRTAMAPNLATMATLGLVSLPGVMTGQILGGADPVIAVKYQVMVMIVIFFNSIFSNILQLLFSLRNAFDKMDNLNKSVLSSK